MYIYANCCRGSRTQLSFHPIFKLNASLADTLARRPLAVARSGSLLFVSAAEPPCALFGKTTGEGVHPVNRQTGALAPYPGATPTRNARGFTRPVAFATLLDTMALAANAHGRASRVPELITSRENR